ncbi:glucuronate isomerase [Myceligenerans salitolerans]|uniref:Uronate isomerase n=1 Tax=Myceligenerans salitolerans TaxID=1230528 RepID=A0ABS3I9L7_9MICO|nr:glucuronate isomerase [Myceligenerans salitolerans]MBO0609301.1 glucuronate isomerase [Myceligenerans salitolerans]
MTEWTLHPDRALPADPATRPVAREIYETTRDLPIVSMHGHVDVTTFADDAPFPDPAQLFVVPDHYLTRMLVSQGTPLPALGVGPEGTPGLETDPRAIWRRFCAGWKHFRGTPTRYWLEHELVEIFGVTERPSAESADAIYDQIAARLAEPDFRPRALLDRFRIETLATTDPAWSDLEQHRRLAAELGSLAENVGGNGPAARAAHTAGTAAGSGSAAPGTATLPAPRVVPTFRPDPLLHLDQPAWRDDVGRLAAASGIEIGDYTTYLAALRERRRAFVAAGGSATDHGHLSADTTPLPDDVAAGLFARALAGDDVTAGEAAAFSAHMLFQMAAMSCEDGLVMQLHPGVLRNHDTERHAIFGPDKGYDIPVVTEYTHALRPVLETFGHVENFRLIAFTVDEDTYSRELAPLAGVYPALRLGAPWWFLDEPDAMRRFREATTGTAGFSNLSGFVDDTRAFCSIPARHDLARRIDAGYLARLVAEHRLDLDEAVDTAADLAYHLPKKAYPAPTP